MKKKLKSILGILLSLTLVLGLMPGMNLTAYADGTGAYNDYLVTTDANKEKSGDDLTALQVTFNRKKWYIIEDNSSSATEGTVTLLAADTSFGVYQFDGTSYDDWGKDAYSASDIKSKLDAMTDSHGAFENVASAIADTVLSDVSVDSAKLYLLSKSEAEALPVNVRKIGFTGGNAGVSQWWLRSPSKDGESYAVCVRGDNGNYNDNLCDKYYKYGVRPALKLNLSSVTFSSDSNSFSAPHTHNFSYSANGATITAICSAYDCDLPDKQSTLIISAPTVGNDATITVSPEGALTGYTVRYQTKSGGSWGTETDTAPSTAGIHKAIVTLGDVEASVTYGNNCITYATGLTNGSISGDSGATCGAMVTPSIIPDEGYQLDTLTVTPAEGSGISASDITVNGGSFIMPEANVTVSATFKLITYTVETDGGKATVTDSLPEQNTYTVEFVNIPVDKTYDGKPVDLTTVTVQKSDGFPSQVTVGEVSFKDQNNTTVTTATNVGTYTASAAVGDKLISKSFEIKGQTAITYYVREIVGNKYQFRAITTGQYIPIEHNPNGIAYLRDGMIYAVKGNVTVGALVYTGNVTIVLCEDSALTIRAGIYHIGSKLEIYTENGSDNANIIVNGEQLALSGLDGYSELNGQNVSVEGASISGDVSVYGGSLTINKGSNQNLVADDISLTLGARLLADGLTDGTENADDSVTYGKTAFANLSSLSVNRVPEPQDPVSYVYYKANGTTATKHTDGSCTEYTAVTSSTTVFADGKWYVVSEDVTVADRITVSGTANLILADGKTLTASKGITVNEGNTLNIYAQEDGTGTLIATGSTQAAGIGGDAGSTCGTLNVHGGNLTATGGSYINYCDCGAGIGGGTDGDGGMVTIFDGTVTANGPAKGAAGIGGGGFDMLKNTKGGNGGSFTIYGGSVNATGTWSNVNGAGIGGGFGANGGEVIINGGTVTATGGLGAAGIGGGERGNGGNVTINGGSVIASGLGNDEEYGMGIGKGYIGSADGTLTLGEGVGMLVSIDNNTWSAYDPTSDNRAQYMKTGTITLETVATPEISPEAGAVESGTTVTITCATEGATIYYTTDGTAPSESSAKYDADNKPAITATCTIKAIAVKDGMTNSEVVSAAYTIAQTIGSGNKETTVVLEEATDNAGNPVETAVTNVECGNLSDFTEEQEEAIVEVELTVKPVSQDKIEEKAAEEIKNIISIAFTDVDSTNVTTEYLELEVTKKVTTEGTTNTTEIHDVERVLEIALSYNLTGKYNPVIIREHEGKATAFVRLAAKPAAEPYTDGTFYVDTANNKIYIYSRYFSTYSVAYSTTPSWQVSFDDRNGKVSQNVVSDGARVTKPADPAKDGYTFAGWYKEAEYTNAWNFDTDTVTSDTVIYAKWDEISSVPYVPYTPSTPVTVVYTITFKSNGGTGTMSSKASSGMITLPANTFERDGFTFTGWNLKADGTGVDYKDKSSISLSGDIILYAQWKAEEPVVTPTPEPEITPVVVDTITKEEKAEGKIDINSEFKVYQSGKKVVVEWGKVEDADMYKVYASYCSGKYTLIKTVTDGKLTMSFKKLNGSKINFSKNFKVYVAAYRTIDGEEKLITKTIKAHVVGSENKKRTNATSISTEKSKYSVKVGKNFQIKAATTLADPEKKQLSNNHAAEFRYLSTDTSVAKVSKDGTVTGVSKGTCYIWVYSRNGLGVKVKVTVK